jgi:hypothetical protein
MICIMIVAMATMHFDKPGLDGDEFMRVLEGLHSEIRDFALVCEGEVTGAAPDLKKQGKARSHDRAFQGSYAYRASDGAAYLDLIQKPFGREGSFLRTTYGQVKGKRAEVQRHSDQRGPSAPFVERRGSPAAFRFPCSPERFIYLCNWRRLGYSAASIGYQCEGWDEIDGNPVLRISIVHAPKSLVPEKTRSRYWVDLNRGGHVLREEFYRGSALWWRVDKVRLSRIPLGGGRGVWFPVGAEMDSFLLGKRDSNNPRHPRELSRRPGLARLQSGPDRRAVLSQLEWAGGADPGVQEDGSGVQLHTEVALRTTADGPRQRAAVPGTEIGGGGPSGQRTGCVAAFKARLGLG